MLNRALPMQPQPHSAEQFGPQRDFWWHRDFLDLMAARWGLREAASLADIGCGQGHWSCLLYPYLRPPARLVGVDREPRWVSEAKLKFQQTFPRATSQNFEFLPGDATSLPLPANSFDVVTCQTVLMHLEQPMKAMREMVRILRPGGLLVCAEPNNLWNYLPMTSLTAEQPIEMLVSQFELWLRYHRGKAKLGQGDHTIGDLLPGCFAQAGLTQIEVRLSDRAAAVFPPYQTLEQQALLAREVEDKRQASGPWDRDETRRCVLVGGGSADFFDHAYQGWIEKHTAEQKAIGEGTFHSAGGGLFYLVSGRKP